MKVKLQFVADENGDRESAVVDIDAIPRKGELLTWDGSSNMIVEDIIYRFNGNGSDLQVEVFLH
jgi:hypothetical protein